VNVITKRNLFSKAAKHSDATVAVQYWFDTARQAEWHSLDDIRRSFPATDMVGALAIFNIRGNRYRLMSG
jgi:mRNA interferase HigB